MILQVTVQIELPNIPKNIKGNYTYDKMQFIQEMLEKQCKAVNAKLVGWEEIEIKVKEKTSAKANNRD